MKDLFSLSINQVGRLVPDCLPDSDLVITKASSVSNPTRNSMIFVKRLTPEVLISLTSRVSDALILVPLDSTADGIRELGLNNVVAAVPNPRLTFARIMGAAIGDRDRESPYREVGGAMIAESAYVDRNALIEPGAFIAHDVTIASGCQVLAGAKIREYSTIGAGTVIRENAVIGAQGFGFERDEQEHPIRLPHLGGVTIGENVEIGALVSVCSGTIDPTQIGDYVKIDNLVHVAHNCKIGTGTMIAACAEISGSVSVGGYSWISPNVSILEGVRIGHHAWVGMGSVVMRNVYQEDVVTGNPARSIRGIASQ